ncbi:uncharacterized protein LOC108596041 [Drosophila busckii]|uniref:uncharacterized protein LOC108596041 n=1 Tax=Drosophila busckii TaxID=30019 RepID=UPI00083EA3C1|nr:uncharacterized protein LOC108596041 [Drosophila busckii]
MEKVEFPSCVSSDELPLERLRCKLNEEEKTVRLLKRPKRANHVTKSQRTRSHKDQIRYEQWKEHRERVKTALCEVDTDPPGFQAARLTGVNALRDNAIAYMARTKANIQMLVELSRTMRTHGAINPFRDELPHVMSGIPAAIRDLEQLDRDNYDIGKRLLDVVSEVDTGIKGDDRQLNVDTRRQEPPPFVLPELALAKYKDFNIPIPSTDKERRQLFRPRIYFDAYLKDARPLGRIVVQLYTEAAPLVVLQLVRACLCNMHQKFRIRRLFPNLWLEVDLQLGANSPLQQPLEYDGKIIDHGEHSNVLSFSKSHLQGFQDNLCFSMSFKPLNVVNGQRVGFGRVIRGGKICDCLQSYGTKNGKLSRGVEFIGCGLL